MASNTPIEDNNAGTNVQGDAQVSHGDFVGGDKVVNVNLTKEMLDVIKQVTDDNIATRPKKQRIPRLLPYLADRSEQEDQLEQILDVHNWLAPLIIIVHGDEYQCHEKFLERLQEHTLPRLLNLNDDIKINDYHVEWPSKLSSLEELQRRLIQSLSKSVLGKGNGTVPDIQQQISSFNSPTIFHLHLLSSDWAQYENTILDYIFRFWKSWPELSPRQQMFIFLFIKYEDKYSKHGFLRFSETLNDRIVHQLEKLDIKTYHPLNGKVLPALEGITRSEAEAWARLREVAAICDPEILIKEIRDLYEKTIKDTKGQISMETLVEKMKSVLQNQFSR